MIYDCFYFYDELDLLEIRLNILGPFVDYFVIVEADKSFNGLPREYVYEKNSSRFSKWNNKIIYYKVSSDSVSSEILSKAFDSPNTGGKQHWWIREFCIKESLLGALACCKDSDVVFVSDVDEIWNPETCIFHVENGPVFRPLQKAYSFFLNNRISQDISAWTGTRFATYETLLKYGPNHFRTEREIRGTPIENGGWHFSWLSRKSDKWGDGHPDNPIRFKNAQGSKSYADESGLPEYLIENKERWGHLFLK